MTPERLTQLRTIAVDVGDWAEYPIVELADALEAAWAERDAIKLDMVTLDADWMDAHGRLSERAERAEAEASEHAATAEQLIAEAVAAEVLRDQSDNLALKFGAALARVRALCDGIESDYARPDHAIVLTRNVRAAIEGPPS